MRQEIVNFFGTSRIEFAKDQEREARECFNRQEEIWRKILSIALDEIATRRNAQKIKEECLDLMKRFQATIDSFIKIDRNIDGKYAVTGSIPILSLNADYERIAKAGSEFVIAALIVDIYPLLAVKSGDTSNFDKFYILNCVEYKIRSAEYIAARQFHLRGFDAEFSALRGTAHSVIENFNKKSVERITEMDTKRTELERNILNFETEKANKFKEFETKASEELEAFLSAQKEQKNITKPVDLWDQSALRHKRNFKIGIMILVLMVALFGAGIPYYADFLRIKVTASKSGGLESFNPEATLTLATVVALIAAAGYVLKIVGRFATNSLTLSEDASMRAALANTFIGLTAEDKNLSSETRDQARTIMLAALFRPLPGHQQEEITAPTVLSLTQDLIKKPSAP